MKEHQYYLDIVSWDMPMKKKIRIMGELMATCYSDHWRVIGITREALNVFEAHNFKRVSHMGINRGHIHDRNETFTMMLEKPILDVEEWWDFFYNRDETILMTSTENMTGNLSEVLDVPPGLFLASGYSWRHGKDEVHFLTELAN